jgi:hypothetical protein
MYTEINTHFRHGAQVGIILSLAVLAEVANYVKRHFKIYNLS